MRTEDFNYSLPEELIAQSPLPRGQSRLLVLNRETGGIEHKQFSDLPGFLNPGDTLVFNDTRVSARRLQTASETGRPAEVLLLKPVGKSSWSALVRPGKRIRVGSKLCVLLGDAGSVEALVTGITPEGGRILEFPDSGVGAHLPMAGEPPLPPYIHSKLEDEERYQTVYGRVPGSAAAPTAGLHFTQATLDECSTRGAGLAWTTLHVGIDTFRPVRAVDLDSHVMHGEYFFISKESANRINSTSNRIIAVGTTTVRTLESAAGANGKVNPKEADTRLFIKPGYRFKVVHGILTNFHLPKSTLLVLVSAFAGRENVLRAYEEAVRERYRFYSFGDAMLIV